MLDNVVEEIHKSIVESNSEDSIESIPHSDTFHRRIEAELGFEGHEIIRALTILKESNKIFTFEITKEDKDNDIKQIVGYVDTVLETIRRLKNVFQHNLMDEYQKQVGTRLQFGQIIKEMYMNPAIFKNTLIGQLANKAIMLDEYEKMMMKHYENYTSDFKDKKLQAILGKIKATENTKNEESGAPEEKQTERGRRLEKNRRAIDSDGYEDYSAKSNQQSVKKILQIYGSEFFFRVNLRKYNFNLLIQIIESGEVNRKDDLKMLREMIQKVRGNFKRDPKLLDYIDEINQLEKVALRHMIHAR